jgi:hypothetical protein
MHDGDQSPEHRISAQNESLFVSRGSVGPFCGLYRGGHAQFQDLRDAHASFEPRHGEAPAASPSFGSQAQQGGRRIKSQATGTSQRYDLTPLPSRPGPHRLPKVSIGRISHHSRGPAAVAERNGNAGSPSSLSPNKYGSWSALAVCGLWPYWPVLCACRGDGERSSRGTKGFAGAARLHSHDELTELRLEPARAEAGGGAAWMVAARRGCRSVTSPN